MSLDTVTSRIQQIESQIQLLSPQRARATGTTTSGADFARAMAASGAAAGSGPSSVGPTTDVPAGGSTGGDAVVATARKYLGIDYVWGGTNPDKGLDCSGLVQLVYKQHGIDLPRVSYQQAKAGRPVASMAEAQPGDILAFNSPVNHVGIYIGNGKMIEAPRTGLKVRVADVPETPTAIRRVLPESASTGAVGTRSTSGGSLGDVPYAQLFRSAGARYGVDPTLLAAVAKQESGFRPDAVSPAGARGLMQLMPSTARGLGVTNSMDPAQAVDGAARLLKDLLGDFGRVDLALAAYNAGPGAVRRYDGIPPYAETQKYVRNVLAHQERLS
ncbi:transglycosylase SLT domain-containing protein [Solicola sp. PLA-1-18]|uniref:transglycosylase SLT domain-containing protein n=1 Tax=Solicola sp. PLA-1-18 TaxID=3380532 RepID=UPI003B826B12